MYVLTAALVSAGCCASDGLRAEPDWRGRLDASLRLYGHRNWIAVVDAAYPAQTKPGVETIVTGANQLEVVSAVLAGLDAAGHVRPAVFVDQELAQVPESDAPGIAAYRSELNALLGTRSVARLPHEVVIRTLDEAAAAMRVLVLKTDLALPYTSVFFRLECGYWTDEAERRLRAAK